MVCSSEGVGSKTPCSFSDLKTPVTFIFIVLSPLKVVTKKIVENGVETVIVEEDGVMTHTTVSGHQVALEY